MKHKTDCNQHDQIDGWFLNLKKNWITDCSIKDKANYEQHYKVDV